MTIVVLLGGLLLLAWGVWSLLGRTPRARAWAVGRKPAQRMFAVPYGGAALFLAGLMPLFDGVDAVLAVLALGFFACGIIAIVFGMLEVPAPGFLKPRWYRDLQARAPQKGRRARKASSAPRATPAPDPDAPLAQEHPGLHESPQLDPAWVPARDALRADIARLQPEGSVMLTADAQRFVEIYHYGDRLSVDCAGSQEWGGPALTDAAQDQALVRLGFTTPMDRRGEIEVHTGFRRYLPTDAPDTIDLAADLAVAALAILGVQPTEHLSQVVS